MQIPRRLKVIVSRFPELKVEQNKRGYVLVIGDRRMDVQAGQIVTLDQWDVALVFL